MDFQKCQRCWTQKALFRCPSCEKHQILCNKCDTYIHSMNKNKFHQRFGLSDNYKNMVVNPVSNKINNEIRKIRPKSRKNIRNEKNTNNNLYMKKSYDDINNTNNCNQSKENIKNLTSLNEIDNVNYMNNTNSFIKRNKTFQLNNNENIDEKPITKIISNNNNEKGNQSDIFVYKYNSGSNDNIEENLNQNEYKNNNSENISQKLNLLNSSQSNQFNNNIFNSTEKELLYQVPLNNFNIEKENNSYESYKIKSQIEEAAKNMIGDMSQIITNINNEERNFNNKCLELEVKYNKRIKEIKYSKNNIISNLKYKIREMNRNNEQLKNDLKNLDQIQNSKCEELLNVITTLKNSINNKEEEIYYMKKQLNDEKKFANNNNEEEKNNLCYLYEEKINTILNKSDENQKKLLDIIKEKERIIQELINANQNKTYNYNNLINKFQKENEEFKDVTQRSINLAGNNVYNKFINELETKNYKYQKNYYK